MGREVGGEALEMFLIQAVKRQFWYQSSRFSEFFIVPKGIVHRPIAKEEVHLMMFVTNQNVNTGDVQNERTLDTNKLEYI